MTAKMIRILSRCFEVFFKSPSFEDRFVAMQNRPSGFDYVRLALALAVVFYHSWGTSYGVIPEQDPLSSKMRPIVVIIIPMFFALSGFLVAGSLERSKTLFAFLGFRALRIMPALAGEVLLSALVLGPLLTTLPLSSYFADPEFSSYFGNIIGNVHFVLPGMFPNNPVPHMVNRQLWTIPIELMCYLTLSVLAIFSIFKKRVLLACCLAVLYIYEGISAIFLEASPPYFVIAGLQLVMVFLAGVVLYRFRDKIPYNRPLFLLSIILCLGLLSNTNAQRFASVPIAYVTCYLGLTNGKRNRLLLSGDYSYGIYLYSAPLQQMIASISPSMWHWYWSVLLGIPCSVLCAAGSWWFIEKPILTWRHHVKKLEEEYIRWR